jgi:hypothetical protein
MTTANLIIIIIGNKLPIVVKPLVEVYNAYIIPFNHTTCHTLLEPQHCRKPYQVNSCRHLMVGLLGYLVEKPVDLLKSRGRWD